MATTAVARSETGIVVGPRRAAITWSAQRESLSLIELAIIAGIVLLVGYLLLVAFWLRVDYFDSYENMLNARAIVHGAPYEYAIERPIFYPVLLAPIFFVFERLDGAPLAEFVAVHLLAVGFFAVFLVVCYRLFRLHLARIWSLAGLLLLSLNVVLIGQTPLAKEDIPGALFTTAAFYLYLRARQTSRWRDFALAGVMVAGVMGTRYQLAPLPFAVILSFESVNVMARKSWRPDRPGSSGLAQAVSGGALSLTAVSRMARQTACLFVLPLALFLLIPVVIYPLLHKTSIVAAPYQFGQDVASIFSRVQAQLTPDPAILNYRFLVEAMTWPLLFCAALGLVTSLRSKEPGAMFLLLWLGIFFTFQTYVIGHKESRYLIALLPPLYFFVARGLQVIAGCPPFCQGDAMPERFPAPLSLAC